MSGDVKAMAGRLERVDAFVNDPISLMPRRINPDGHEAAAMLRALQAEIARLRAEVERKNAALRNIRALAAKSRHEGGPNGTLVHLEGFASAALAGGSDG